MSRKTTAKKSTAQTPRQQVEQLKSALSDCQKNISTVYKKAIDSSKKQIAQLKKQLTKAKQKWAETKKAQIKQSNSRKGKSALTNRKQITIKNQKIAEQAIKNILKEIIRQQKSLLQLQQDQKKFAAGLKAQRKFDKQWKQTNAAAKKKQSSIKKLVTGLSAIKKKANKHTVAADKEEKNKDREDKNFIKRQDQDVETSLDSRIVMITDLPPND